MIRNIQLINMESILGKDVTWYIYRKIHRQYLNACFKELFFKIYLKDGDILKLTDVYPEMYRSNRQQDTCLLSRKNNTPIRGWKQPENYWDANRNTIRTFRRPYPQWLKSKTVRDWVKEHLQEFQPVDSP